MKPWGWLDLCGAPSPKKQNKKESGVEKILFFHPLQAHWAYGCKMGHLSFLIPLLFVDNSIYIYIFWKEVDNSNFDINCIHSIVKKNVSEKRDL